MQNSEKKVKITNPRSSENSHTGSDLPRDVHILQVWNEFVNSTEEQQQALLNQEDRKTTSTTQDAKLTDIEEGDDSWEVIGDKRTSKSTHFQCHRDKLQVNEL